MLRNLSEKLGAKFPSTTFSYPTGRISHYVGAFSKILGLEESPEEHRKDKGQAKKYRKPKYVSRSCLVLEILISAHARTEMS